MIEASAELIAALRAGTAAAHLFVYLDHPAGAVHCWSGVGSVEWNGQTWLGLGHLGSIDRVKDTGEIQAHAMSLSISGVDSSLLKFAASNVRNRTVQVFERFADQRGVFYDEFRTVLEARMDFSSSDDDGETGTIQITTHSPISDWDKSSQVAWTHEEQQERFPGDTGFDRIPGLSDKEITGWAAS